VATMMMQRDRIIDRLSCAAAVKAALKKAIAWESDERFADVGAFCEALKLASTDSVPRLVGDRGNGISAPAEIELPAPSRTPRSSPTPAPPDAIAPLIPPDGGDMARLDAKVRDHGTITATSGKRWKASTSIIRVLFFGAECDDLPRFGATKEV